MERTWLTSQELCSKYGVKVSYKNAARAAKNMVSSRNLPYYKAGYKWIEKETA